MLRFHLRELEQKFFDPPLLVRLGQAGFRHIPILPQEGHKKRPEAESGQMQ